MDLKAQAQALLQGEPLRAISYGAVAVVWIASRALAATGHGEAVTFDAALVAVTAAVATVTELARRYVYSPATVTQIVTEIATDPTDAGVVPEADPAAPEGDETT